MSDTVYCVSYSEMLCLASIYYLSVSPQIRAEFKRVVTTDLLESFLDRLDVLVPRQLEVQSSKHVWKEAGTQRHFGLP